MPGGILLGMKVPGSDVIASVIFLTILITMTKSLTKIVVCCLVFVFPISSLFIAGIDFKGTVPPVFSAGEPYA